MTFALKSSERRREVTWTGLFIQQNWYFSSKSLNCLIGSLVCWYQVLTCESPSTPPPPPPFTFPLLKNGNWKGPEVNSLVKGGGGGGRKSFMYEHVRTCTKLVRMTLDYMKNQLHLTIKEWEINMRIKTNSPSEPNQKFRNINLFW